MGEMISIFQIRMQWWLDQDQLERETLMMKKFPIQLVRLQVNANHGVLDQARPLPRPFYVDRAWQRLIRRKRAQIG